MTPQRAPLKRPQRVFIAPLGLMTRIAASFVVLAVLAALIASGAIARAASGTVVADRAAIALQQLAAQRDLERGFEVATDQVRKVRALKLAIPAQQADAIAGKALADLAALRHSALVSLAQTLGATADAAETSAKSAEQALDAKRGQAQPSVAPVLLAPRLYAIAARFNQLATQISDQATADLTQSPTPAPSTATPTLRGSSTPSPTR